MVLIKGDFIFDGTELTQSADTYREPSTPKVAGTDLDLVQVYSRSVREYGSKTQEEFVALLNGVWQGDEAAREEVILSFSKLGFYFVGKRMFPKLDVSDVISVTNLAVVEAIDRAKTHYDVERGPFASWMIRQVIWALLKALGEQSHIVKVRGQQRACNRRIKALEALEGPQSNAEIAEKLGIPAGKVEAARLADVKDVPLDTPLSQKDGAESVTVGDTLESTCKTPEQLFGTVEGRKLLRTLCAEHLTPFQARIVELTYGLDSDDPERWEFREAPEIKRILGKRTCNVSKTHCTAIRKLATVPGLQGLLQVLVTPDRIYGKGVLLPPATAKTKRHRKGKPATVPEDIVREMRRLRKAGWTIKAIADRFRIPFTSTYSIVSGKYYKYVQDANE